MHPDDHISSSTLLLLQSRASHSYRSTSARMRDEHAGQVFNNPRPPTSRNPLKGPYSYIPPPSCHDHEKRAGSTARSHGGYTSPSSKQSQRTQSSVSRSTNTNSTTRTSAVSSRRGGTSHTGSNFHRYRPQFPVISEVQDDNASTEPASTVAHGALSGTEVIEVVSFRYERYERPLSNRRAPTTNSPAVFIAAGITIADPAHWNMYHSGSYYADHTRVPLLEGRRAEHQELEYTMTDLSNKRQIHDWQDGVVKGSRRM